jgi:hypothetical protein
MAHDRTQDNEAGAALCGPLGDTVTLSFPGVALQVQLRNAPDVERALTLALRGWVPAAKHAALPQRISSVQGGPDGYATRSSYLDESITGLGVAGATCAVIADLAQDYFETRPGCLALHCAAFRYAGRLIAMTGPSRAGKSTLASRMTQEADIEVFCDDVLPLPSDGLAVSLGIAPRLRLPIPATASPAFKSHVARYMTLRDDRYGYLCAPTVAPHGTRAPLSVLLILDRRESAPARLHAAAEDEALHFLLSQNMSDLQTPEAAFSRLTALLDGIICLRLVYSDLEEAVALIRQAFGSATPLAETVEIGPALPQVARDALPRADIPTDLRWSRHPEAVLQNKGDSAFLWLPGKPMIWHMNFLARAIWTLLEVPGTARDIAQVLAEIFPDTDADVLIRDVAALLNALSTDGLVEPASAE